MASLLDPPTPAVESRARRFAVRGLRSAVVGIVIAGFLTGLGTTSFRNNLIHSVLIAVSCWFSIDGLRLLVAHGMHRLWPTQTSESDWPGWPVMMMLIVVGTFLGFTIGGTVSSAITGEHSLGFFRTTWTQAFWLVLVSLVPGTVITYWFYSRETIAAKEAAVQTAQRQAAEHQLKLLESQLEPHMLFNTLANLRVLIGLDPKRAQAMLDQLIAFLRATLNASRVAQHPLRAEFARLTDYLALMRVRMGDRLQTRFELPDELAELPVPPLLLQPLVENCIKHGLEPAVEGGRIDVSAARERDTLVLRVRDTGAGLSDQPSDGTRFGLVQIRERLATLYGNAATFTLANAADAEGGTLATIRLPIAALTASATSP